MEPLRNAYQGITNIIRFNWHFYAMAIAFIYLLMVFSHSIFGAYSEVAVILSLIIVVLIATSLLVSYYIYDVSELYSFNWLSKFLVEPKNLVVNIHAGFDETSGILKSIFPETTLVVLDFYDPLKHTEISIKRARKAYPAYLGTLSVSTSNFPKENESVDIVFVILAAHEIRSEAERVSFFKEIKRILKPQGSLVLVEHLRDWPNFIAYTLGVFHFYSRKTWYHCVNTAKLTLTNEHKITPFIHAFFITKHGNTP